jgi:hypothetical protein
MIIRRRKAMIKRGVQLRKNKLEGSQGHNKIDNPG